MLRQNFSIGQTLRPVDCRIVAVAAIVVIVSSFGTLLSQFVFGLEALESLVIGFAGELLARFGAKVKFVAQPLNRALERGRVILQE